MNILFVISSDGKGSGGHYNSLNQVSLEIGKHHQVQIILLGKGHSPIIESNPFFNGTIPTGRSLADLFLLKSKIKRSCQSFIPDVINCFDSDSLLRMVSSGYSRKTPIVLNKCGGPNPLKSNYQHANAIVVFSQENQKWFLQNKYYTSNSIFLIPNRVRKLEVLPENKRVEKASKNRLTFLRVSRLGGAYEMTLHQTFHLLDELCKNFQVELFIIGKIQDEKKFNKLKEIGVNKSYPVKFITDERAFKGSDFLYLADFVIGTGRSFMEATSLGIPTLTPAKNTKNPILVNKKNISEFLSTNFSERNRAPENSEAESLKQIQKIITDPSFKIQLQKDTFEMFDEYFGTKKIYEKYNLVYKHVIATSSKRSQLISKNLPYLIKYFLLK